MIHLLLTALLGTPAAATPVQDLDLQGETRPAVR